MKMLAKINEIENNTEDRKVKHYFFEKSQTS